MSDEPTAIPTTLCPTHSVRMKPDPDGVMTCPVSGGKFVIEDTFPAPSTKGAESQ